mmetsp:Transcript_32823/g.29117  ORF Transcript_32823/g.29117 Transcript_32823/m.29117 type:complete len:152 (+) Transcript_32823:646-1101(+)
MSKGNEDVHASFLNSTISNNFEINQNLEEILSSQAMGDAFKAAIEQKDVLSDQFTHSFLFASNQFKSSRKSIGKRSNSKRKIHNKSVELTSDIKNIPYENLKFKDDLPNKLLGMKPSKKTIYKRRESMSKSSIKPHILENLMIKSKLPEIN